MSEADANLAALKNHALFPFRNATTDKLQYLCLELYWLNLFKAVLGGNTEGLWRAWHPPDLQQEGNPVFSVLHTGLRRGVRVIHRQMELTDASTSNRVKDYSLQAFLTHNVVDPTVDETPVLEFCILSDVSAESEKWCRYFWKLHCLDARPETELEAAIVAYEREVGMPPAVYESE